MRRRGIRRSAQIYISCKLRSDVVNGGVCYDKSLAKVPNIVADLPSTPLLYRNKQLFRDQRSDALKSSRDGVLKSME